MSPLSSALKKRRDEEAQREAAQFEVARAINMVVKQTTASIAVTAAETPVLAENLIVGGSRYIAVRFWAECNVAAALTMTCRLYVDSVLVKSSRQFATAAGYWHLDWNPYAVVTLGHHTIAIRMLTSTSSFAIAAGQAQVIFETRGVGGSAPALDKEVALTLTPFFAMPDGPSAPVLVVGTGEAKTISTGPPGLPALVGDMTPPTIQPVYLAYQRLQDGDDAALMVAGGVWEGQTFTTVPGHTCNRVAAKLYRISDPGAVVTASVYAVDGGGLPTGAVLATGGIVGTDLSLVSPGATVFFDLGAGVALGAATKYALVLSAPAPLTDHSAWAAMGALTDVSQAANRNLGWAFTLTANRNVTHLSVYPRTTANRKLQLWRASDSTLLGSVTGDTTANVWTHLALGASIALTAGATYVLSYNYIGGAGYHMRASPAAGEFFVDASFVQGRFSTTHDVYPATADGANANGVMGFRFDAPGRAMWRQDASAPPYATGSRIHSVNGGATWAEDLFRDYIFEEGNQA